ncbi:MAG: OmpA/MotB family protein, partial [Acetivibrio ethanolgignens]
PVAGGHDPATEQERFDELYRMLKEFIEENNYEQDIEISKGDGFTFITFRDSVFFDGDSFQLKEEGKRVLDKMAEAIGVANSAIQEVRILGHTSQAKPDEPNEPISDRFLASNRATEVLLHIQMKNIIDPAKLVACSYGQFRPISSFETKESRAENRRVEVLITKNDSEQMTLEEYYKEIVIE